MKKLLSILCFCMLTLLLSFALFSGTEEILLEFLQREMGVFWYISSSFVILALDILAPVPSSLVMILNGKVLGVPAATFLSTASGLLSSAIGFWLGQQSGPILGRFFSEQESRWSSRLFLKFGLPLILFSKALPLISESVSIMAGTTSLSRKNFLWLSLLWHFGISVTYACLGHYTGLAGPGSSAVAIIFVLLLLLGTSIFIRKKTWIRTKRRS